MGANAAHATGPGVPLAFCLLAPRFLRRPAAPKLMARLGHGPRITEYVGPSQVKKRDSEPRLPTPFNPTDRRHRVNSRNL
jgi:hypothetical protein